MTMLKTSPSRVSPDAYTSRDVQIFLISSYVSCNSKLIYLAIEAWDPPVELDEVEYCFYNKDSNVEGPEHDLNSLHIKFQEMKLNAETPSPEPVCTQAFKMAESHMWDAFQGLRSQLNHNPFHARKTRRETLLKEVSSGCLPIENSSTRRDTRGDDDIGFSPTAHSSSYESSTTRSTVSSQLNPPDDTTATSNDPYQVTLGQVKPSSGANQGVGSTLDFEECNDPFPAFSYSEPQDATLPDLKAAARSDLPDPRPQSLPSSGEFSTNATSYVFGGGTGEYRPVGDEPWNSQASMLPEQREQQLAGPGLNMDQESLEFIENEMLVQTFLQNLDTD